MPLFSGVKSFWVIQNNEPVIRSVKKLNARGSARSISTFDFSTLYTKIPHDKLIFVLNNLIVFCFKGGTNKYVALSSSGAHWRNEPSDDYICYNKEKVKSAVKYLIDNCYFTLGGKLYRQSKEFQWDQTQHHLWQIYFFITMKINGLGILKRQILNEPDFFVTLSDLLMTLLLLTTRMSLKGTFWTYTLLSYNLNKKAQTITMHHF